MLTSQQIRQTFLDFFEEKGHQIVPSAPIVVKDDPTLMFTNAGMNPFKDYFLGNRQAPQTRVADTQRCLRVSGKHNDLEDVGYDTYHHTMFEMLGNWSFGDYFKTDAIAWAWELLTNRFQLPKDRLYVTVFEGDSAEDLAPDEDARMEWQKHIDPSRILNGNKKDNFWEMGETGPCGPCSEIHIDLRTDEEIAQQPGHELVNNDHPQVVEIWNLVFMEFNRKADGSLVKLPNQHVDTGMGFERLCMAIQKKRSNYDTDVFTPTIGLLSTLCGKPYTAGTTSEDKVDIAFRVIADHLRAIFFIIADGQTPSNNKAGYVLRRILRRAVRYGYTYLGFEEPFLYSLIPSIAAQFVGVFEDAVKQTAFAAQVVLSEETAFFKTLANGIKRLDDLLEEPGLVQISGKHAFELYDTFGFPPDLTALIASEKGITIDEPGFEEEMAKQKERSRQDAVVERGDWVYLDAPEAEVEFVGYDTLETSTKVLRYRPIEAKGEQFFQVVISPSPFYAESGGQVGDVGYLEIADGQRIEVLDTKKENTLIFVITEVSPGHQSDGWNAVVDAKRRKSTSIHHSATHLLHAALRKHVGTHVEQRGSLVSPDRLRFDFSSPSKITEAQIASVKQEVEERIAEQIALQEDRAVPIAEAKAKGAMALFGEKYGDSVRVITFGEDFSVELCGGTHVQNTAEIGTVEFLSEASVGSGIRRIEAVAGPAAIQYLRGQAADLQLIQRALKVSDKTAEAVEKLLSDLASARKASDQLQKDLAAFTLENIIAKVHERGESLINSHEPSLPSSALKNIGAALRAAGLSGCLSTGDGEKLQFVIALSDEMVAKGLQSGALVKELATEIGGGGGGQPTVAIGSGVHSQNNIDKLHAHFQQKVAEKAANLE